MRLNRFFWADGEAGFKQFLAEAQRYSDAGYLVELQVRYRPTAQQEGDMAAWTKHVREVVDRFGAIPGVIALQITNEVNFDFSSDSSDGYYKGGKDALIQGVIAAKDEARKKGLQRLKSASTGPTATTRRTSSSSGTTCARTAASRSWTHSTGSGSTPTRAPFPAGRGIRRRYRDGMVNALSFVPLLPARAP